MRILHSRHRGLRVRAVISRWATNGGRLSTLPTIVFCLVVLIAGAAAGWFARSMSQDVTGDNQTRFQYQQHKEGVIVFDAANGDLWYGVVDVTTSLPTQYRRVGAMPDRWLSSNVSH